MARHRLPSSIASMMERKTFKIYFKLNDTSTNLVYMQFFCTTLEVENFLQRQLSDSKP